MTAADLLMIKRPHMFWISCATHTLNLMLEGIGKLPKFKGVIEKAKAFTIFIYAHHKTLALMRKHTKKR
ncbi:DUF domain-containing protein, partial [Mycobacterium kansasii]